MNLKRFNCNCYRSKYKCISISINGPANIACVLEEKTRTMKGVQQLINEPNNNTLYTADQQLIKTNLYFFSPDENYLICYTVNSPQLI